MDKTKASKLLLNEFQKPLLWLPITLLLLTPIYFALSCSAFLEVSDFGTIFYTAARMVAGGKFHDLYPVLNTHTFFQSSFTNYSHKLLPSLGDNQAPLFLYPPLVAYLLTPLSYLSPQEAFFAWQILSILALCLSIFFVAQPGNLSWVICLGMSLLYLPILYTLLTGQFGIIIVLLPLSLGYFLLMRGYSFAAGVAWSLLILKIQFLPMAFLLVFTLFMAKQLRCAAGFALGLIVLSLCSTFCLGVQTTIEWAKLLNMADALASNPAYSCSLFLQTSLDKVLLQLIPVIWRIKLRLALYLMTLGIGVQAFFTCAQLIKRTNNYLSVMPYVFILGAFLMPLISPHLLYYDLSILSLAVIVIYGQPHLQTNHALMRDLLIGWVFIDLYLIAAIFTDRTLAQPLLLVAVLVWLYIRILKVQRSITSQ